MAMQVGMGISKLIVLLGAGFTGSLVLRNARLSDILGDLQTMLKGLEKSKGDGADSDFTEDLTKQVLRLANEVRQLASARPITVVNGNSGNAGDVTSFLVPAATVGALGYGYMWWKGISFSNFMYVTKRNMATAVSSMTKHLEQVSSALAAAKRHLKQRIENLDGKLDEQKAISADIRDEVIDARDKLTTIGHDLNNLQDLLFALNGNMYAIEVKQNFTCASVLYLCQSVDGKDGKFDELLKDIKFSAHAHPNLSEVLDELFKFSKDGHKFSSKRGFLGSAEPKSLKGLQQIAEAIESGEFKSKTEAPTEMNSLARQKNHSRTASIKF